MFEDMTEASGFITGLLQRLNAKYHMRGLTNEYANE